MFRFTFVVAIATACIAVSAPALENGNFHPPDDHTWQMPNAHLYGVDLAGSNAIAVGYWGTALYSRDRGETWKFGPTPTSRTLFGISFADSNNAWAVGDHGTVLRTRDGGETWNTIRIEAIDEFGEHSLLESVLFDVSCVSAEEVWISGDFGALVHTKDGGATWDRLILPEEVFADGYLPDRLLNGIEFQGAQNGWIAGEFATGLRTLDGGETWINREEIVGAISDLYLFDVAANDETAIAGGVGGAVLVTRDNGKVWSHVETPTTAGLFTAALRGNRALLAGDRGEVVASRDGGETWFQPKRPRIFNWFAGSRFGDDGVALVVGERGAILRSTNGGDSFEEVAGAEPLPIGAISVPEPGRSDAAGRTDPSAPN